MNYFEFTASLVNVTHVLLLIAYSTFIRSCWNNLKMRDDNGANLFFISRLVIKTIGQISMVSAAVLLCYWVSLYIIPFKIHEASDLAYLLHLCAQVLVLAGLAMAGLCLVHYLPDSAAIFFNIGLVLLASTLFALLSNHFMNRVLNFDLTVFFTFIAMQVTVWIVYLLNWLFRLATKGSNLEQIKDGAKTH